MSTPSALAVLRLITSSNLVDCSTGRSVGFVPRRILSDRKSTRLNSSHSQISYAVFCLKKKNSCTILLDKIIMIAVLVRRLSFTRHVSLDHTFCISELLNYGSVIILTRLVEDVSWMMCR